MRLSQKTICWVGSISILAGSISQILFRLYGAPVGRIEMGQEAFFEFRCYTLGLILFMAYLIRRKIEEDRAVIPTAVAWLFWVLGLFVCFFAVLSMMPP